MLAAARPDVSHLSKLRARQASPTGSSQSYSGSAADAAQSYSAPGGSSAPSAAGAQYDDGRCKY